MASKSFTRWARRLLQVLLVLGLMLPLAAIQARDGQHSQTGGQGFILYLPLIAHNGMASSPDGLWHDVDEASLAPVQAQRQIVPLKYRTLALNRSAFQHLAASAPSQGAAPATGGAKISLPLPDGRYEMFTLFESPIMEPGLAAKFPDIKTYAGQGIDDPAATIRLDWTLRGFHGIILSPAGTVYIDPYSKADTVHYISYFASDVSPDTSDRQRGPDVEVDPAIAESIRALLARGPMSSGSQLRTYRLAVAATGEYTQAEGGTVAQALAAIVTTINRVDGIYEREVAVRLVLVANNNQIVYTNAATDPYNNDENDGGPNQTNIDNVIGSPNYDIGHVFNTGTKGLSNLGCVCTNSKAHGVSGLLPGVAFDMRVAHEMGHQFGANHTWNGTQVGCTSGQRNPGTAYEPGSGSTIMGYPGRCGSDDVQSYRDPYFHSASIDEIVAYTTGGNGNSCPTTTSSGNGVPTANASNDYAIPVNTPFTLTGSGSDPDGDALTYDWEEFDNTGPAGPPNNPNSPPYFRSFSPTTSPSRTFPRIEDIVNNTTTIGEILPNVGGTLKFRLTVRDNRMGGGGVNQDEMQANVTASAGPFLVTSPNTAVTWQVNGTQTVTWNVANTTAAPVSCATVNILLSTDGGFTYPLTLASGVPNNGSATLAVPNYPTTRARVMVACATNIFFDISNANFTIKPKADAGGPYVTNEGTDVVLDASGSSGSDTYAWDFNDDGVFNDATGLNPVFNLVGQDGVYPVAVRVTKNGVSDIATSTVTVNNVTPSIASLSSNAPKPENSAVTVNGMVTDPGWLDPLTAVINWGDGSPAQAIAGTLENIRPDATLTFTISHVYGDNGSFTAQVCASDDDTTTCENIVLPIQNVDPTAEIDQSAALVINGVPTFLAHAGVPVSFSGRSRDPGSDDLALSWDWGDGPPSPDVTTTYLVNPPNPDPFPSPSIQPRDVTDVREHAFSDACRYVVNFRSVDDDGGNHEDTGNVVITGNADRTRSAGYWQHQYGGNGHIDFDRSTLECYLAIVDNVSRVFHESRDASTIEKAYDVLFMQQNGGSAREQFDRELLVVWLNFANGAFEYDVFADVIASAEAIRLDPNATEMEIRGQKDILHQINS